MEFKVQISAVFNCDLERAFKTPMLCDVTKVHTGFGLMPKITHTSDDELWGKPGSTKKVYAAKSLTQKGGYVSLDKVLERKENDYWKIEVSDFQAWMLGFYKFEGVWKTKAIEPNQTLIEYTYTLFSNSALLAPLGWLFAKLFWKTYMQHVMRNIEQLVELKEPYLYD